MDIIEVPYEQRHDIRLPDDLRMAPIDKRAFGFFQGFQNSFWFRPCLPWRFDGHKLIVLLADSPLVDEESWHKSSQMIGEKFGQLDHDVAAIEFRSSGLEPNEHMEVLDFLHRRANSNISCTDMFTFACPMRWGSLERTADNEVRHCNQCQRNVYLVANEKEFENRSQTGDCVAYIPPELRSFLNPPPRPSAPDNNHFEPIVGMIYFPEDDFEQHHDDGPPLLDEALAARGSKKKRKWWDIFGLFEK